MILGNFEIFEFLEILGSLGQLIHYWVSGLFQGFIGSDTWLNVLSFFLMEIHSESWQHFRHHFENWLDDYWNMWFWIIFSCSNLGIWASFWVLDSDVLLHVWLMEQMTLLVLMSSTHPAWTERGVYSDWSGSTPFFCMEMGLRSLLGVKVQNLEILEVEV